VVVVAVVAVGGTVTVVDVNDAEIAVATTIYVQPFTSAAHFMLLKYKLHLTSSLTLVTHTHHTTPVWCVATGTVTTAATVHHCCCCYSLLLKGFEE
jgi:hypothetical protein